MAKHTSRTSILPLVGLLLWSFPMTAKAQEDEYDLLHTMNFSPGTQLIFIAYVAIISATIGEYRHAIGESTAWTESEEKQIEAKKAIWRAAFEAIGIFMALIIAFGIAIPLLTNPLDERMLYIINGFSRLTAAVVLGLLSIRIALWVGIYYPYRWTAEIQRNLGATEIELKHSVRWSVSKNFLRAFFFLITLFQEGADPITIPVSIITGILIGFLIDFFIYKCRRFESERTRRCSSIFFVSVFLICSILAFADGVFFIAAVWDDRDDVANSWWPSVAVLVGIFLLPIVHILIWQLGRKRQAAEEAALVENPSGDKPKKQRMATSMFFSDRKVAKHQKKPVPFEEEETSEVLHNVAEGDENEEESESAGVGAVNDGANKINNEDTPEEAVPPVVESGDTKTTKNNSNENNDEDDEMPPTLWQLMMQWQFCGCVRGNDKSTCHKVLDFFTWFVYLIVCAACVFCLITNIGATYQQEAAREKLPAVAEILYNHMDRGPVCAFDNRGSDSNITTFADKDAAHDAGFLILHCGACAACSDWHNLELEYTTRDFLASESRKCAQKSLFGGGYDTLVECLEDDQIGFQGQCAICWADDILCTKSFCAFIGIQSFMINTLTNFAVGEDTITAAACEEAHCEAGNPGDFVACSGANRRRMNVTSTISRPGTQQCSIVDVDWAELFPEPHPYAQ